MTHVGYIGNFRPRYSTENDVLAAMHSLGWKVTTVQEDECDWRWVPAHAKASGVDFVLWTHTHTLADETRHADCWRYIAGMADAGIPTVGFHLDRWWGLAREHQVREEPFFAQSIVCTADGGHDAEFAAAGVNHVWLPPAVSHHHLGYGEVRPGDFPEPIVFVGSWGPYHPEWPWRRDLIRHLQRRWGGQLGLYPRRAGEAWRGQPLKDLYTTARVVVGDSCLAGGITHYWSDRVPETLGRGGLLLHPHVVGLADEFPCRLPGEFAAGDTASLDAAIEKALGLSDAERRELTDEAITVVEERHTYRVRMQQVIEIVERHRDRRS